MSRRKLLPVYQHVKTPLTARGKHQRSRIAVLANSWSQPASTISFTRHLLCASQSPLPYPSLPNSLTCLKDDKSLLFVSFFRSSPSTRCLHPQHGRLLCFTLIQCVVPAYDGHVKISKDSSRKRQKTDCPSAPATQIQNREIGSTYSHAPPSLLQPLPGSYTTLEEPELGSRKALE